MRESGKMTRSMVKVRKELFIIGFILTLVDY